MLACALYAAAGLAATWPAVRDAGSRYLAEGAEGHGEAAPGDHLQTGYRLWLVGHQLERGRAPWRDPYEFRPEVGAQLNPAGWPFGLPYWPLARAFGAVGGWNAFILLSYLGAGGLACWWLRSLGLGRGPALVGGLAYALAPYRVAQSAGHLLGVIAMLLPLALLGLERGRRPGRAHYAWLALAGAALASIPLSGQVHLALGAIPFFCLYAACRSRDRRFLLSAALGAAAAVGAGLAIRHALIAGSIDSGGRSLAEVEFYSADWQDLLSRSRRQGNEQFALLGWATPLIAAAGLALLVRARRVGLATVLGVGAVVPVALALGTNLPLYRRLYEVLAPLRYPRVPERLLPIACLALAALVALAAARLRPRLAPLVLVLLVFADLRAGVTLYGASAADEGNAAYAAIDAAPAGRVLELPVFLPDRHYGSVYLYYSMQAPRERPLGYSTLAPLRADEVARELQPLTCGDWSGGADELLRRLGVRYVA
ncbi:MAG: hypothetical protein ABR521_00125, partial [Gaiellaceae bacterium]